MANQDEDAARIPRDVAVRVDERIRNVMAELESLMFELQPYLPENQRKPFSRVVGDTILMVGDHMLYPILDMYPELNVSKLPEREGFVRIWGPRSAPEK